MKKLTLSEKEAAYTKPMWWGKKRRRELTRRNEKGKKERGEVHKTPNLSA